MRSGAAGGGGGGTGTVSGSGGRRREERTALQRPSIRDTTWVGVPGDSDASALRNFRDRVRMRTKRNVNMKARRLFECVRCGECILNVRVGVGKTQVL